MVVAAVAAVALDWCSLVVDQSYRRCRAGSRWKTGAAFLSAAASCLEGEADADVGVDAAGSDVDAGAAAVAAAVAAVVVVDPSFAAGSASAGPSLGPWALAFLECRAPGWHCFATVLLLLLPWAAAVDGDVSAGVDVGAGDGGSQPPGSSSETDSHEHPSERPYQA